MSTQLELVIRAKSEFDAAFRSLQQELDKTKKKTEGITDEFKKSMTAGLGIGAGFTLGAKAADLLLDTVKGLGDAIKEGAHWAEELGKGMRETGLSSKAFQQMTEEAIALGYTTEDVVMSVGRMQKAIEGNNPALQKLGLNILDLKNLTPEQQFQEIAAALTSVADPTSQAALAMEVFGKSGARLLPLLDQIASGSYKMNDTVGDGTTKALSKADEALDRFTMKWQNFKREAAGIAVEIGGRLKDVLTGRAMSAVFGDTTKPLEALDVFNQRIANFKKGANLPLDLGEAGPEQKAALEAYKTGQREAAAAAKKHREELAELHIVSMKALDSLKDTGMVLMRFPKEIITPGALGSISDAKQRAFELGTSLAEAAAKSGLGLDAIRKKLQGMGLDAGEVETIMGHLPAVIEAAAKKLTLGGALKASLSSALKDLPGVILGAIQGGGNVGGAVGSHLGGALGDGLAKGAGKTLEKVLGKTLGGALGSLIPGLGSLLGGGLGSLAGKLFGGLFKDKAKEALKEAKSLTSAFVEQSGGLEALTQKAKAAGISLEALFAAKNKDQAKSAIDAITAALQTQEQAQEELQKVIEKYGFTIDELGPKFRQQKLDEQAMQLFKEFELLRAAGVDVSVILSRMGPAFIEFVQTVRKSGGTIPEAMRPAIDALIKSGQLTDENGNAFTSAEDAGIKFAESLTDSVGKLVKEIEKLVKALLGIPDVERTVTIKTTGGPSGSSSTGTSGGTAPTGSGIDPTTGYPHDRPPGYPPNLPWPPNGMAHGGVILPFLPRAAKGMITARPTLIGEANEAEVVAPVKALFGGLGDAIASKVAAVAGGGGVTEVNVYIDGQKLDAVVERRTRQGFMRPDAAGIRRRG